MLDDPIVKDVMAQTGARFGERPWPSAFSSVVLAAVAANEASDSLLHRKTSRSVSCP